VDRNGDGKASLGYRVGMGMKCAGMGGDGKIFGTRAKL